MWGFRLKKTTGSSNTPPSQTISMLSACHHNHSGGHLFCLDYNSSLFMFFTVKRISRYWNPWPDKQQWQEKLSFKRRKPWAGPGLCRGWVLPADAGWVGKCHLSSISDRVSEPDSGSDLATRDFCRGLFITPLGRDKLMRNLRLQQVLQAVFELHNVGEIQLPPVISGFHVIHHFY